MYNMLWINEMTIVIRVNAGPDYMHLVKHLISLQLTNEV